MKFSQFQRKVGQGWFSEEARIILQEEELGVKVVCKRGWVKTSMGIMTRDCHHGKIPQSSGSLTGSENNNNNKGVLNNLYARVQLANSWHLVLL